MLSASFRFGDGELYGRADELSQLRELLTAGAARIVTLIGPGGVGKTRLAWAAMAALATRFPDHATFVPLVALDDASRIAGEIARHLGIEESDERLRDGVHAELREKRMLLVLDNLEHLPGAGAEITDLADNCPRLTILITSRRPLKVPGELLMPVTPLPLPSTSEDPRTNSAVELFCDRATRVSGAVAFHDTALAAVAEICRRVDGLPLAIELAAAKTRTVTPAELLERLGERLPRLTGGPIDGDPRHATMRDAVAWSYGLLAPELQMLFRRLSVFVGGFTLKMAEHIAFARESGEGYPFAFGYGFSLKHPSVAHLGYDPSAPEHDRQDPAFALALSAVPTDVLDGLTELLDNSLLVRNANHAGNARYEMLETIREFGLTELERDGEAQSVRHAHAAVMLAFAEATAEGLWYSRQRMWPRERVDAELPNVRSALEWALAQGNSAANLTNRLSGSLWIYWQTRGAVREGIYWMERSVRLAGARLWTLSAPLPGLGFLLWIQGDDTRATRVLSKAVEVTSKSGDKSAEGTAHFMLGLVAWRKGPDAVFEMIEHLEQGARVLPSVEPVKWPRGL